MLNNTDITKINGAALGLFAVLTMMLGSLSGCSNAVTKKSTAKKVPVVKSQSSVQRQIVVINQPKATAGSSAKAQHAKRDQHHVDHDKKRMWYNRQWLVKQDIDSKQRVARKKYQQQYEQSKQQQQSAVRQQQDLLAQQQSAARQQQQLSAQRKQQAVRQQYHQRFQQQQDQQQALVAARQQQQAWHQNNWQAQQQARNQQIAQQRARSQQQVRNQQVAQRRKASLVQQRSRQYSAAPDFAQHLSNAAIARTYQKVRYDGRYIPISYPMGDVPANIGVCTDTVIRSYRRLGVDLQRLVHEDMSRAFHAYPNLSKWGLSSPDPNIDHRRVHNLKVFFSRHGQRLPITGNPADYRPGDLVTWDLGTGGQNHIGLVVNRRSPQDPRRHMIVHNIAKGDRMEDILFTMPITGHYRYFPQRQPYLASSR